MRDFVFDACSLWSLACLAIATAGLIFFVAESLRAVWKRENFNRKIAAILSPEKRKN